jgi:hypothetical protein
MLRPVQLYIPVMYNLGRRAATPVRISFPAPIPWDTYFPVRAPPEQRRMRYTKQHSYFSTGQSALNAL